MPKKTAFFSLLLIITLLGTSYVTKEMFLLESQRKSLKEDKILLLSVKYGIFNVDEWKKVLNEIISKKIDEFNIDESNRPIIKQEIESKLYTIIDELEENYYKHREGSVTGWVQGAISSITGIFNELRNNTPQIAEHVIDFMDDEDNKEAIKEYLMSKLDTYTDSTFSGVDYSAYNEILHKYDVDNKNVATDLINYELKKIKEKSWKLQYLLFTIVFFVVSYLLFLKTLSKVDYLLIILITIPFLISGVSLPMIEIDARLSTMSFTLLGENVNFENQILYYKSKSIIEVFWLMISNDDFWVKVVGALVIIFSVLFPLAKITASALYMLNNKFQTNKKIEFLAFKIGKWSMADVFVIAIFMSFLGFRGILSEQLLQIEDLSSFVDIVTTNESNLLFGFYSFLTFVLISMLISFKLQKDINSKNTIVE